MRKKSCIRCGTRYWLETQAYPDEFPRVCVKCFSEVAILDYDVGTDPLPEVFVLFGDDQEEAGIVAIEDDPRQI